MRGRKKRMSTREAVKDAAHSQLSEPPATEKPATPSIPLTSQYVVTVNNVTGLLKKIEKLDEATGDQTELSGEEYTQWLGYASPAVYSDVILMQTQLYYQSLTDYMNMLGVSSS
jgi:hypothetical protein